MMIAFVSVSLASEKLSFTKAFVHVLWNCFLQRKFEAM